MADTIEIRSIVQTKFGERFGQVTEINGEFLTIEFGKFDFINQFKALPGDEQIVLHCLTANEITKVIKHS